MVVREFIPQDKYLIPTLEKQNYQLPGTHNKKGMIKTESMQTIQGYEVEAHRLQTSESLYNISDNNNNNNNNIEKKVNRLSLSSDSNENLYQIPKFKPHIDYSSSEEEKENNDIIDQWNSKHKKEKNYINYRLVSTPSPNVENSPKLNIHKQTSTEHPNHY
ncbi:hypothetical protein DLAC_03120 [Tieghemostelium lacteum]|uniref:Uncharacterized protein n=1 Tax=Tieghemostelium lacteum TaxID=361077 RepID=A0A152A2P5_TIELA|nr:hypothetical protein DLAC_03120 [Tieghemostelium lacteum]|eukprot:KYR00375.1 hypothetical protein DLAC_03120 [Tieghemostelium lacteum]